MPIITLITDFGTKDHYVGALKGSILKINPKASLVDITHEISDYTISDAAFVLEHAYSIYPKKTIHLVVVDPGVGGKRRAIVVRTLNHFFVGPDNGIFTPIFESEKVLQIVEITNPKYWNHPVSSTFHGRDIFAPVAAHLSLGLPLLKVGRPIQDPIKLQAKKALVKKDRIEGEIIYVDHFGNCMSNISETLLASCKRRIRKLSVGKLSLSGLSNHYGAGSQNPVLAIIASSGLLEFAVKEGNSHERFGIDRGTKVMVHYDS